MLDRCTSTTSWYAVWHHVMLHDLVFMMLRCFTLPERVLMMLRCLMLSTSCYAASLSLCHTKLLRVLLLFHFELVFMMLRCLMLSVPCYAASPSLPHVKLLHLLYIRSSY